MEDQRMLQLDGERVVEETENIKKMKWGETTTYGYQKSFSEFAVWLKEKHPSMIDDQILTPDFRSSALVEFCSLRKKFSKKENKLVNLSFSGLNRFRSAVAWKMKSQKMVFETEEAEQLSDFFSGLKKRSAREKQNGERDVEEGKREMPFEVYKELARWFWRQGKLFELTYMVLTWNLCCRTNNTEAIRMGHIAWYKDSLEIVFGKTKSNQDGERKEVRLIFANPHCPPICPVLVLGAYLASSSTMYPSSSEPLFPGGNQASRFNKSLKAALSSSDFLPFLKKYGQMPDDLGAHSLRKGAGTYLCSGSTASPSHASVCIRMSWSLGATQERYLHYNKAADGYCGRILCGLPQNSIDFALLPPHPPSDWDLEVTTHVFPSISSLYHLERVRQYCLSSLLFHLTFVGDILPPQHPLFYTPFASATNTLKEAPLISGIHSLYMSPTGLPPHVLTWVHQQDTMSLLQGLPEKVLGGVGGVLKENGVAAGNITREVLEDTMRKILESGKDQRIREEGAIRAEEGIKETWERYLWGGKFRLLPEDFVFPPLNVFHLWNIWWSGVREKKTPPFSLLTPLDVPQREKKRFSDFKCLMREMMAVVVKLGFDEQEVKKLKGPELAELGKKAMQELGRTTKKQRTRVGEWAVGTALRELRQAKLEKNPELKRKQSQPTRTGDRAKRRKRMFGE